MKNTEASGVQAKNSAKLPMHAKDTAETVHNLRVTDDIVLDTTAVVVSKMTTMSASSRVKNKIMDQDGFMSILYTCNHQVGNKEP